MTFKRLGSILTTFASASVLATASLTAQAQQPVTLSFGHVLQENHPYHAMALKFAEELKTRAPEITVRIFPAGQLGDERALIEGLQTGSVDIATVTSALTANFVPQFRAFSLPFLFRDTEHLFAVMDSEIGEELAQEMKAKGLIKLGYGYGGARDLYTQVPVQNLNDLQGIQVRTMENPAIVATWTELGAIPTPISWNDVYISLQQRLVQGGEGTGVSYKSMNFDRVAPHYTRINYILSWHNLMMSQPTFDRLSPAQQEAVLEAGEIAAQYQRALFIAEENALFEELAGMGVSIHTPTDADDWRARAAVVLSSQADNVGGQAWIDRIQAVR